VYVCCVPICYGVATSTRILKIIRLFREYRSLLQGSFAKEDYIFKEPTNRSHPIPMISPDLAVSQFRTHEHTHTHTHL